MIKVKKIKPTDQSEIEQPVVGEADTREPKPDTLIQPFTPMVEPRAVADLIIIPAMRGRTATAKYSRSRPA